MNIVIVESPAKAKTINKYLGKDFKVLASYGHVRDLPSKDGSVQPDNDFEMEWDVDTQSAKRLKEIADAVKGSDSLILATDPDREGEAISWHVLEVLKKKKALKDVDVKRVVFNAITKAAVLDAMAHPREIDSELVDAYLARRALDYLVGFTLSPVLWRRLPGSRSAGRVQSVALKLVCEREAEIEAFVPREYWSVEGIFDTQAGTPLTSRLTHWNGEKLDKFDINNEDKAKTALADIEQQSYRVASVTSKPAKRNPSAPFTTSTLQQEASRKLGFAAARTMQVAQRLYEGVDLGGETVGLITYMRTDGVQMADEAIDQARATIQKEFGDQYLPEKARVYRSKARNAQEAHEAIRPTDLGRLPSMVAKVLDADQLRLYELIWKRAISSQMESAALERTTIDITSQDTKIQFRATGSVLKFDGYLKVYQEGKDDAGDDDDDVRLPQVSPDEQTPLNKVTPSQHFTEPPPRFSEATLVKRLEELGIGRPSTYASILSVLRDRKYVYMDKNRFHPEDKGRLVTAFLDTFFTKYVEYDFTAELEEDLDKISAGDLDWKVLLRDFWKDFTPAVEDIVKLRNRDVLDAMNEVLGPHVFPQEEEGVDPRKCKACDDGILSLKTGRYGAFVGCSNYPDCKFTRQLTKSADGSDGASDGQPKVLGEDPATGREISLKSGRFGPYIQLAASEDGEEKAKNAGIPKEVDVADVNFDLAVKLLSLPRHVGDHPETGKPIMAANGRYGPYLQHDGKYARLESFTELFEVGLNRAVTLIAEAKEKGGGRRNQAKALRELGPHPEDEQPVNVMDGRYGPYVKHGKINATIPQGEDVEKITLERALELIDAKAKKKKPAKKKAPAKKTAAKKTTAKKTTKKTTAKKTTAKKPAAKKTADKSKESADTPAE